ncbi:MAG: hypothetical protein HY074_07115, partial [Deltaproteobacteria bacterium]|nr:hypothetical protein [Deltaproteobacteria bacterium]
MSKISGLALVATGLVCMACSAAFADESDAAARGALYTQSVVCIPAKLIALDESARKGLVLDL